MTSRRDRSVLIVMDDFGGGTGNHVLGMIRHWDRSDWHVGIFSYAIRTARVVPDCVVEMATPLRGITIYPINQIRRLLQLRDVVKRTVPDILHAYFFWPIIYGRMLKLLGLVQYLVENREDQGFSWGRQEYFLLRLTRSLPDRVVCVSNAVREVVLAREGLDPNRVVVIHNGIAPTLHGRLGAVEARHELGLDPNHVVVGMVANLNRAVKGAANLLDAIPEVVGAVPAARFVLVGRVTDEGVLREQAERLGIQSYVVFAGFREDIDRFYAMMDVSVLTSFSEGLSITLLESMNAGLPVVATAVGGNPEVVVEGVTGYLVPAGDNHALSQKLVALLEDPDLRQRMGEAGRQRVNACFRIDRTAHRYLDLYGEMLSAEPHGSSQ